MPSDESKGSQLDAIGSLAQRQLDNTPLSAQSCFAADCGPLLGVTCSVDVSAWQARIVHRRRAPGLCVETPAHQCQSVPLRPEREYVGQHGGEPRNMTP